MENTVWKNEEFAFYDRDEIPLNRKNEFANFETLKSYFVESQNRLQNAFLKNEYLNCDNIQDWAGKKGVIK